MAGADILRGITSIGEIPVPDPLTVDDFDKEKEVDETKEPWGWHRGPGRGGKNVAGNYFVPDGHVLVGWEHHTMSQHRTKGAPTWYVLFEAGRRGMLIPRGVRVGIRLTPGKGMGFPGGLLDVFKVFDPSQWTAENLKKFFDSGGAAFTGYFKFYYVNEDLWREKY